jgi:general L-amino acid transport system substrate-binding protein
LKKLIALFAVLALVLAACGDDASNGDGDAVDTLAAVQERGSVRCGVNDAVPGFGFLEADGSYSGFDIDFCRALAAAIFDDPNAVTYVPLTAPQRFTALQSREIDVLIRNTTFTATRDGAEAATFATTTFYDGQGMMVRVADGFTSIDDMDGTTICTLEGTTTEMNLANRFANMTYTPATFTANDQLRETFIQAGCDGWTSDKSQLAAQRSAFPAEAGGPDSLVIFEESFSKEPLGPAVLDGDSKWAQIVDWTVLVTIMAEEFGVTSQNIDTFANTDVVQIQRLLGHGDYDPGLGLPSGWPARVIRHVGNYGEIFERHLGMNTPLGLERGLNDLYTRGGLLYAPPY